MRASENHEAQASPSTKNMVLDPCRSLRKKGHIVAFDRFFSTVPLIDRLHEAGMNAVGTIDSRKAFQSILFEKDLRKNQFVGRIGGQIDRGEGEDPTPHKVIFIWKDTKAFRVISNYHGSDLTEVQRMNRNGDIRNVTCPKAIADYGMFMGGVDRANQYASYYERDRRSKKWWHRIFYSLLEMTLVNSWICFNELMDNVDKKDNMTILDFKRSVTMGLLAKGLNIGKPAGRAENLEGTVHPSAEVKNKRRKRRLSTRNKMRFANVGIHVPIFFETHGRCEWCQSKRKRTKMVGREKQKISLELRPYSKCERCNVHLCISKKRNCFKEYHDKRYHQPQNADKAIYSLDDDSEQEFDPDMYEASFREGFDVDQDFIQDNGK
jgi:hypothetical protein